ncbi:MAG: hypothetical protein Q9202_000910 [Teloschistes flavicans]
MIIQAGSTRGQVQGTRKIRPGYMQANAETGTYLVEVALKHWNISDEGNTVEEFRIVRDQEEQWAGSRNGTNVDVPSEAESYSSGLDGCFFRKFRPVDHV